MESTNQGIPLGGNPSPFSYRGDVGAPHMATLSLPGLTIGLPVWLFSTSVVQNTTIPEQSNQQLDESRVTHQPSTSSPPSSSLDGAGKAKTQVTKEKKEKKKKEKKKKEPKANGGKRVSSSENPHTVPTRPKSAFVICKGDHYHRYCPCIPRILRDWSPHLHNPVSSTSDSHVENTPSTTESEALGKKGKYRFPCKLWKGDHAVHRCPFLDEAKIFLDDHPVSPLGLPPGYKKSCRVRH